VRPYETRYWVDGRRKSPISRGFPKAQEGSIEGAARAVASGFASKVQCITRPGGRVLWTVKAGPRVPGVRVVPVHVERGDA
jgi:hypothetical protein